MVCQSHGFMVSLFIFHIRPIRDFCSSLWSVSYLGNIKFESVQRRWTRDIASITHLSYVERLEMLGLYSIDGRLICTGLIVLNSS